MSSVPWSNETERADYYKKLYNEQLAICDRLKKDIEISKTNIVNIKSTDEQFKAQEQEANVLNYIKAEAKKEFAEELIYKIVNTPTKFESTYYMYRDGIAFRQNEIIDIIKELAGDSACEQ